MPRAMITPSPSSRPSRGDELETRLCQLWFWEGFFARRGINLQRQFHPQPLQITDLDLLAFEFSPTLQRRKYIGEAKSGTSKSTPAPLDRIVWLRGLIELTNADGAELTIAGPVPLNTRELALSLGVVAQSITDLERREQQARITDICDLGNQGITALEDTRRVHQYCKQDPELERAFWFLRSEVWLLDPWLAIKRCLTAITRLSRRWVPGQASDEDFALRWLLCEGTCIAALNIVTIAGDAITFGAEMFADHASDRLSEGLAPREVMVRVADMVDKFLDGVLSEVSVPASVRVDAMGAFLPKSPIYTEPLIELAQRLATGAIYARHAPRYLDLVLFERVLRQREITPHALRRLGLSSIESVERASRLILHFLQGQARLPSIMLDALQGQPGEGEGPIFPDQEVPLDGDQSRHR